MLDKNVEAVIARLKSRAAEGLDEYGQTTERQDLNLLDWLFHLQDELLDAAVYTQKLISMEALAELQRLGQEMERDD